MVRMKKHQAGALMFELMIVLAIAGIVLGMQLKKDKLDIDQVRAKSDGLMVAQINNAIRKRLADEGSSMVAGTYVGVNWLHATTCPAGLASKAYLPCHMSGKFHYELTPVTTVTIAAGAVSASTNFGIIKVGPQTRIDLASLATLAANNENIHGETPIAGTFYSYEVDTTGQLIASATYDNGLDQWLRTDGGNAMQATLNMNGNTIDGALDINATGNAVIGGTVTASDHLIAGTNKSLSRTITDAVIMTPGTAIAKPICNAGQTAQIFVQPVFYSNRNEGGAIQAVQSWASLSGANWIVHMRILVEASLDTAPSSPGDGWITDSDFIKSGVNYGLLSVVTKCS